MSEIVRLGALRNSVHSWIYTYHEGQAQNYDARDVGDLFARYISIIDSLRLKFPSQFTDLPVRKEKPSGTMDYEGRGYFHRTQLEALLIDIDYCVSILSGLTTVNVPSMKLTREGIFFAGQYFDAIQRVGEIMSRAQKSITIIDGYVDNRVLDLLSSKNPSAEVKILTRDVAPALKTTAIAFNRQYGNLHIRKSNAFHDRFVIVDDSDFYHFGASIKDLGDRGFMFSRIEEPEIAKSLLDKFNQEWSRAQVEI